MLKTPPLQTATATIDTLCGRLQSATLLEDRRNAIMGLRSFAKQYPASVAGGSLRELITILRRDGLGETADIKSVDRERAEGDVDTIRLVLETLLLLFSPDSSSPEASDEIALFMADEFSMRQDNVTLLLSFLDPTSPVADYYSRLYSVQLLSAICAARPERLQECILGAPLGVSRLLSMLDDSRDAVRNAGLLFLVDLTTAASDDLRKIVAFEDVFGKAFALIRLEGGLGEAGITVQDCLSLLANLLRDSASNQTMFRESGCVKEMYNLLQDAFPPTDHKEVAFVSQNREKATWGLLQLLAVLLTPGQTGTAQNQAAFFRAGSAQTLIDLGFLDILPLPIRISALRNAALLIDANAPLQEAFASLSVVLADTKAEHISESSQSNGTHSQQIEPRASQTSDADQTRTYVIEALLGLSLYQSQKDFVFRSSAVGLIEAYLHNHSRIKAHFLQRAIAGHAEQETDANVLITLLHPATDLSAITFASQIVAGLISGAPEAKDVIASVKEGDESEGEDVLTVIQILATHLREALQYDPNPRTIAAYVGLLTVLLWEFSDGVDQLLAEGSSLIQMLVKTADANTNMPLLAGLSAVLLGTIYEFSTKDSPIPRRTQAQLLTQKLGQTKYLDSLNVLRKEPAVRDFDLDDTLDTDRLLNQPFIDLFTIEYTRLRKAIDKDPGIEVVHISNLQAGVDRDVLDTLREELTSIKEALSNMQAEAATSLQQHERERMVASQDLQKATVEVERIKKINEAIQHGHEKDQERLMKSYEQQTQQLRMEHSRTLADAKQEEKRQAQQGLQENDRKHVERTKDVERRLAELGNSHRIEQAAQQTTRQQLETLSSKHKDVSAREATLAKDLSEVTARQAKTQRDLQDAQVQTAKLSQQVETLRPKLDQLEAEIDKVSKAKEEAEEELKTRNAELKAERAGFTDLEREVASARSRITSLEKEQAASKETAAQLKSLEKELATAKGKVTSLAEDLATEKGKATVADKELATAHSRIKSLETDLDSAQDKAGTEKTGIDKLRKDLNSRTQELAAEKVKVGKLEKEVQVAKKALTTAQSKTPESKTTTASKDEVARIAKLEKEASAARDAEKSAKEELESMLLVMSDIESKRDEYRARVKELGGEISEEEDDEEDNDDEEEEEEEADSKTNGDNDDVD